MLPVHSQLQHHHLILNFLISLILPLLVLLPARHSLFSNFHTIDRDIHLGVLCIVYFIYITLKLFANLSKSSLVTSFPWDFLTISVVSSTLLTLPSPQETRRVNSRSINKLAFFITISPKKVSPSFKGQTRGQEKTNQINHLIHIFC